MEIEDKIKKAVRFVSALGNNRNLSFAYSCGKDSVVLNYITKEANVKVRKVHNVTTIDPEHTLSMALKNGCKL